MDAHVYYEYIEMNGERFFTVVLLPAREGRFPTVILRSPYVKSTAEKAEDEIVEGYLAAHESWLARRLPFRLERKRARFSMIPYTRPPSVRRDASPRKRTPREATFAYAPSPLSAISLSRGRCALR